MQLVISHTHPAFTPLYDEMEKHAGMGTWIYDKDSGICSFSTNFCRIAGISKEQVFERFEDIAQHVHPDDREWIAETASHLLANEPVPECEYRVTSGARTRYVRQYGKHLRDSEDGQQVFGFWQDITRWRIKGNSYSFLESLIDANFDGIIVLDPQYKVLLWNRRSEIYTGVGREQALGSPIIEVLPALREHPQVLNAIACAMNGLTAFQDADGSFSINGYYETHYVPIKSDRGHVTAVLILLHDVAHRIKAENEIKQQNKQLRLRNAEAQAFSLITSHDFKEPIARIYTSIELLLNRGGQSRDNDKRYLRQVQGALQRIRLLADDIAQFYRFDTAQTTLPEIDLNKVLSQVMKRLESRLQATETVIESAELPMYRGHFSMLSKLFQHFISAAITSARQNVPPVVIIKPSIANGQELQHEAVLPEAQYLVLRFSDNGNGSSELLTGEEFLLCEKIAELHGGFIAVERIAGSGTVVCCYLQLELFPL